MKNQRWVVCGVLTLAMWGVGVGAEENSAGTPPEPPQAVVPAAPAAVAPPLTQMTIPLPMPPYPMPGMGPSATVQGQPPASPAPAATPDASPNDPVDRAQFHMKEAIKALGEAGGEAYQKHSPELRRQGADLLNETKRLIQGLEEKLRPDAAPPARMPEPSRAPQRTI